MTEEEFARHDSKTLLQLLLSADARCDDLTAQLESTLKDRKLILAERDRTFALMLARAEKAEAENARLREAGEKAICHITGYGEASTARIELRAALKGETP